MERRGFLRAFGSSLTTPLLPTSAIAKLPPQAPVAAPQYTRQMFGMAVNYAKRAPKLSPEILSRKFGLSTAQAQSMLEDMMSRNVFTNIRNSARLIAGMETRFSTNAARLANPETLQNLHTRVKESLLDEMPLDESKADDTKKEMVDEAS